MPTLILFLYNPYEFVIFVMINLCLQTLTHELRDYVNICNWLTETLIRLI